VVSNISDDPSWKKNATFQFSEPNFNPAFHPWTLTVTGKAVVEAVVDSPGGYISTVIWLFNEIIKWTRLFDWFL